MSWVIICKKTNIPIWETYSKKIADKVNTKKYFVLSALDWLNSLNHK